MFGTLSDCRVSTSAALHGALASSADIVHFGLEERFLSSHVAPLGQKSQEFVPTSLFSST